MEKKAVLVVLLSIMWLAVLSISNTEAAVAPPWYLCAIKQVGANWTNAYVIMLSDTTTPTPRFTNVTFFFDRGHSAEMYVAALTAFASGCNVLVNLNGIDEGSRCIALYAAQ